MKAPGILVKVNDTYMHVYSISAPEAQRKDTIVLLSGSGTECPTYDFKPLWLLLAEYYNIAVVERPGYGWSGYTKKPRDIDTMLEETRAALRHAEITEPFIPAAHSLSGLEAIYWKQKYPDEISAIIGLDMAVPPAYDDMKLPALFSLKVKLAHLMRKSIAGIMVKNHPAVKSNILDEDEQAAMRYISAKQLMSKNMMDEIKYVKGNAKKVAAGECPPVPLLCFLSSDKEIAKKIPVWGEIHRDYFAANSLAQFVDLPCGHYVHREEPKMISEAILDFLSKTSCDKL